MAEECCKCKWWQGRPPCEELQHIKAKYHDTWMQY